MSAVKLSSVLFVLAASAGSGVVGVGCASKHAGGPDDAAFEKGPPPIPCNDSEDTALTLDDPTALGASASELLAKLLPLETKPLFWVPYNDYFTASFTPGVSKTRVTLELSADEREPVVQHVFQPLPGSSDSSCGRSKLDVPVQVGLKTDDGALDEHIPATLGFFAASTAGVSVFLSKDAIAGKFAVTLGAQSRFEFLGLYLGVSLWRGGSRGSLAPEFRELGSTREPDPGPPGALIFNGDSPAPAVPQHWSLFAVWPHQETCTGTVYDLDERLAGWSPNAALEELMTRGTGTLQMNDTTAPVHFTLEPPPGPMCVQWNERQPADFGLRAPGRLQADPSAPASALEPLAALSDFEISGHISDADGALDQIKWERPRGPYAVAQSQADFIESTGLHLDAADADEQFFWSWEGNSTRAASGAWTTTATFSVQNARADEGKICQATQEPPPGAPRPAMSAPSCVTFPLSQLGDTVLSADLVP